MLAPKIFFIKTNQPKIIMQSDNNMNKSIAVIGGGPAGLMAAETLINAGVKVDLYDSMPSAGLKFLRAGKGGLNLTHSEPMDIFLSKYGAKRPQIEPMIKSFGPENLRQWVHDLGIETFVGSSGRVFPIDMKAAPILRLWLKRLISSGVNFHMRHSWCGWDANEKLCFKTRNGIKYVSANAIILALGGGSWKHLGSDASWIPILEKRGIPVSPLKPSNCGFDIGWSEVFRTRFEGQSLKPVSVTLHNSDNDSFSIQGEIVITSTGLEGSLIYSLSAQLRDRIEEYGSVTIDLDLAPGKNLHQIVNELSKPRGSASMSNHVRKRTGIEGVKTGLLREIISKDVFNDPVKLGMAIKSLPLKLIAPRPINEAISTAGGVCFEALDENLMIRSLPGIFCAGEMLDWEAPTGGYLLTACFASGRTAGLGALKY